MTNAALASGNATLIASQAAQFDKYNNYGSNVDQHGVLNPGGVGTELPTAPAPPAPLPTLSISDASVAEGKAGSTTVVTVTITLSAPSATPVTVTVGVTGGPRRAAVITRPLLPRPSRSLPVRRR